MSLSFNTTGPCIPGEHYMLPPVRRLGRVQELIEERKFFTLHAGRQTGKTTSLMWLAEHYNATGRVRALWVDIETAREQPDPQKAFRSVLGNFDRAFARAEPEVARPTAAEIEQLLCDPSSAILNYLLRIADADPRPLVLLIDETDGLVGEAMVSFLTQLRQGYIGRSKAPFAESIVLVGQRQVRDYVLATDERRAVAWLGTTSPFNIAAEATTLGPFTRDEVGELLAQHTTVTGQRFEPAAIESIAHLSQGHPWLTNALANEIVSRNVRDPRVTITAEHVDAAKETLILERRSHIDSLVARLREPRVQRILAPMLTGERTGQDVLDDDFAYVLGLGLVTIQNKHYEIANPIYREVIPRALTFNQQAQLHFETSTFVRPDGSFDMPKLMLEWQEFWRKDGHLAAAAFGYQEAGPHLMLMAFLQRIVNGGGRIEREYALGRGALDLLITWRDERHAIEVKLRRDSSTEADAVKQLGRYLDHLGLSQGWLLLFDLRKSPGWKKKLFLRKKKHGAKQIVVVGS